MKHVLIDSYRRDPSNYFAPSCPLKTFNIKRPLKKALRRSSIAISNVNPYKPASNPEEVRGMNQSMISYNSQEEIMDMNLKLSTVNITLERDEEMRVKTQQPRKRRMSMAETKKLSTINYVYLSPMNRKYTEHIQEKKPSLYPRSATAHRKRNSLGEKPPKTADIKIDKSPILAFYLTDILKK